MKMMHWGDFGGMGYGGFGFGWIFMVLFWALVILGIVYFIKQLFSINTSSGGKESAEDILKKKYAAGEITKNEFEEKMTVFSK